ncbi:MAG: DUF6387 family protein [Alteromonas macleodii]|nr:DUF6387 family protein [Alteromonas macleodii]
MKKLFIKSIQDMPAWFNHDNYKVFEDFSFEDLYKEIQARVSIDSAMDYFKEKGLEYSAIQDHDAYERQGYRSILSGSPVLKDLYSANGEYIDCLNSTDKIIDEQLSSSGSHGVRLMGAGELRFFNKMLEDNYGTSKYVDDYNMEILDVKRYFMPVAHLLQECEALAPSLINVTLDLADFTDREIISKMEGFLSTVRKQLNVPEPDKNRVRAPDRNKILTYKVLQTLDLQLWQKFEGAKIKRSVLMLALYTDGEKGEVEFDATVKPFIEKLTSGNVILPIKKTV